MRRLGRVTIGRRVREQVRGARRSVARRREEGARVTRARPQQTEELVNLGTEIKKTFLYLGAEIDAFLRKASRTSSPNLTLLLPSGSFWTRKGLFGRRR